MQIVKLIIIVGLVAAISAENADSYVCRLRLTNVTKAVVDAVQDQTFDLQFEFVSNEGQALSIGAISSVRVGVLASDEETEVEVIYEAALPTTRDALIASINYPDLPSFRVLTEQQLTLRCSNMTYRNTSSGFSISLHKSYRLQLGARLTTPAGRARRPITLEAQAEKDCYVLQGYQHPYTLEERRRYVASGERFTHGCSSVTRCSNGGLSGVSRCPPFMIPPTMINVRKVGQCCDHSLTKSDVEQKGCPKDERGSAFEKSNPKTYVPWQVRFQKRNGSMKCDGVIIEKNWFLSTQTCLNDIEDIEFLRPLSIKDQPTLFRNASIVKIKSFVDWNVDLALAKIDSPFVIGDWTTQIQKVNLFWNQSVCEKFVQKDCRLFVGTEQKNNRSSSIVAAQVVDREPTPLNYLRRIKKRENLPIPLGSGVVGWFEKANFLAGIYIGNAWTTMVNSNGKLKIVLMGPYGDTTDTGDMIISCYFLDRIRQKMQEQ